MMCPMATDRLTRHELSWLLAQEARNAADLLRKGARAQQSEPDFTIVEVSSSLDVLDDAMKALASLNTGAASHSRRGRIDIAALLLELAPGASISLAPGSGTEVFGDEAELRRILQVLVSLGVTPSPGASSELSAPIGIKRVGEDIRITVALGPDSSVSSRMEQAWLHRMATRHGGRFELDGGQVVLSLPAGADAERREVQELRRELAAAQEQGEAYARELASIFAGDAGAPVSSSPMQIGLQGLPLQRFARALSEQLRPELQALSKALGTASGEGAASRLSSLIPLVDELHRFGQVSLDEPHTTRELSSLLRSVFWELAPRAERKDLTVEIESVEVRESVCSGAFEALCYLLLSHAIEVTPRTGTVRVSASLGAEGLVVTVEDEGPAIPASSRAGLLSLDVDGAALGRPSTTGLFLASSLARSLSGELELGDAVRGGARVRVIIPAKIA